MGLARQDNGINPCHAFQTECGFSLAEDNRIKDQKQSRCPV